MAGARSACEAHDFDPARLHGARDRPAHGPLRPARRRGAARLALADAGLTIDDDGVGDRRDHRQRRRRGDLARGAAPLMLERGPDRVSPFAIPLSVANMGAGQVSMRAGPARAGHGHLHRLRGGHRRDRGAAAILRRGDARAMLAGGGDTLITPFFVAGFDAMRVLSHRNDDPPGAARPFDQIARRLPGRRGRGGGGARAAGGRRWRAAPTSSARSPATAPAPTATTSPTRTRPGRPRRGRCGMALDDAGLRPEDVDYVNAARRREPAGRPGRGEDAAGRARRARGGRRGSRSAPPSRCTATAWARPARSRPRSRRSPSRSRSSRRRINLHTVDPDCVGVDHVANVARPADIRVALSASYGLGGHNAVLALTRVENGSG